MDSVKFTRKADGTYLQSGSLPVGTRTVRVLIDGRPPAASAPRNAKEYVKKMVELTREHPESCKAQEYELIPVDITPAEVIAEKTERLVKARAAKKAKQ